jgi:hypothetical protein
MLHAFEREMIIIIYAQYERYSTGYLGRIAKFILLQRPKHHA